MPDFPIEPPTGPGQEWTLESALAAVDATNSKRLDFERARSLFHAVSCGACHRFSGLGGGVGLDLTSVPHKFDTRYLLKAIIDPGSDDLEGGTSDRDADIIAALNAMMATLGSGLSDADTANGTNVRGAIVAWFTTGSDNSAFGAFTDDLTADDLTGGIDASMPTPQNAFHTEVDDLYRDFRMGIDVLKSKSDKLAKRQSSSQ